jgi:PIN domain nuclease of toxin-antitoxin system
LKYILDTHTFIWWNDDPQLLSEKVVALCEDPSNKLFVSLASVWEMQIKLQLKKLKLSASLESIIEQQQANNIELLTLTTQHILNLSTLPMHHKDPFDRLIISQANMDNAILLSADKKFELYDVKVDW